MVERDNSEPKRHDAAVEEIRRRILDDANTRRGISADGVAAELVGTILLKLQSGEDPHTVHRGFLEATLWLLARGTETDQQFLAAIMAFQAMLSVSASAGRSAALQGTSIA